MKIYTYKDLCWHILNMQDMLLDSGVYLTDEEKDKTRAVVAKLKELESPCTESIL